MKPPVADVVIVVPVNEQLSPPVGVWSTALNDTVALEVPAKSVPTTFQLAPTGPWRGVTEMIGSAYTVAEIVGVEILLVDVPGPVTPADTPLSYTVSVMVQLASAATAVNVGEAIDVELKVLDVHVVVHA